MATTQRVHYYHAAANALGGHIETPFEHSIPVQAPLSLPPVGGYALARAEAYQLQGILSFKSASTQVAGSVSRKNASWTTLVTSTIEGLNVLEIVTADRVVAQISTEHPREGYIPKVTFAGTRFENLRIAGCPVEPVLNLGLCSPDGDAYPKKPCIDDERFLSAVTDQYRRCGDEKGLAAWIKDRKIPDWVRERYTWDNSKAKRDEKGSVLCSLVQEVRGEFTGKSIGHMAEVAEFGKIFLAELNVDRGAYRLTMLRLELGCLTHGHVSFGVAQTNGSTEP